MNALARIESGKISTPYWKAPWGEPHWIRIPAGEFWMGDDNGYAREKPAHRVYLAEYQIAPVPITNAQYAIYIRTPRKKPPSIGAAEKSPKAWKNIRGGDGLLGMMAPGLFGAWA